MSKSLKEVLRQVLGLSAWEICVPHPLLHTSVHSQQKGSPGQPISNSNLHRFVPNHAVFLFIAFISTCQFAMYLFAHCLIPLLLERKIHEEGF